MRLTNSREIAMISDDVRFRYECNRNALRRCVPVTVKRKMERNWNGNGTRMECKWNANGTHLGTRPRRVPNAFSVRLFLSSTVYRGCLYGASQSWVPVPKLAQFWRDPAFVVISY